MFHYTSRLNRISPRTNFEKIKSGGVKENVRKNLRTPEVNKEARHVLLSTAVTLPVALSI